MKNKTHWPRLRRRGELDLATSLVLLSVVALIGVCVIGAISANQPQPIPEPPIIKSVPVKFTAQERQHLGLLNRLAAAELLRLSSLPEDQQLAEEDWIKRLTAAYRWSDSEAGIDAIFGNARPPKPSESPKKPKEGVFDPEQGRGVEVPASEAKEPLDDRLSARHANDHGTCPKCRRDFTMPLEQLDDTYWAIHQCPCGIALTVFYDENGYDVGVFGG